jgi:hypothetical protein
VAAIFSPIKVSVAYYDTEHANAVQPNPWNGSPNITFWGGTTDGLWDGGAILIQNVSKEPVVIGPGLYVDHFADGSRFEIWDSYIGSGFTLEPGQGLILTQTAGRDFDASDTPIVNSPSQRNSFTPLVHITVNGHTLVYVDAGQVLNAGGFDPGQSEGVSESAPWQLVASRAQPKKPPASLLSAVIHSGAGSGAADARVQQPVTMVGVPQTSLNRVVAAASSQAGTAVSRPGITLLLPAATLPTAASPTGIAPIPSNGQGKPAPSSAATSARAVNSSGSLTKPSSRAVRLASGGASRLRRSILGDPAALDELAGGVLEA